jgi:hypothetical protein
MRKKIHPKPGREFREAGVADEKRPGKARPFFVGLIFQWFATSDAGDSKDAAPRFRSGNRTPNQVKSAPLFQYF